MQMQRCGRNYSFFRLDLAPAATCLEERPFHFHHLRRCGRATQRQAKGHVQLSPPATTSNLCFCEWSIGIRMTSVQLIWTTGTVTTRWAPVLPSDDMRCRVQLPSSAALFHVRIECWVLCERSKKQCTVAWKFRAPDYTSDCFRGLQTCRT